MRMGGFASDLGGKFSRQTSSKRIHFHTFKSFLFDCFEFSSSSNSGSKPVHCQWCIAASAERAAQIKLISGASGTECQTY
jgi:hypothetical protein